MLKQEIKSSRGIFFNLMTGVNEIYPRLVLNTYWRRCDDTWNGCFLGNNLASEIIAIKSVHRGLILIAAGEERGTFLLGTTDPGAN